MVNSTPRRTNKCSNRELRKDAWCYCVTIWWSFRDEGEKRLFVFQSMSGHYYARVFVCNHILIVPSVVVILFCNSETEIRRAQRGRCSRRSSHISPVCLVIMSQRKWGQGSEWKRMEAADTGWMEGRCPQFALQGKTGEYSKPRLEFTPQL